MVLSIKCGCYARQYASLAFLLSRYGREDFINLVGGRGRRVEQGIHEGTGLESDDQKLIMTHTFPW
jgi:hypothetical protein